MSKSFTLLSALLVLWFTNALNAEDFAIRDGETVGFLGDSITAARTYGKHIEKFTLLRYPERKVHFINLGRGGDTAAGGLKRLERDVFDNGVTLLTVAYGVNDIGWGAKADDEHRQLYLDSIRKIVAACKKRGVRVYICSAAITAGHPDKTKNDFLQQMCDAGLAIARDEGAGTIDIQRTMRDIQRSVLTANESLPIEKHESLHVADGIHLNDLGQMAMAYAILKGLGAPADVSSCVIDAAAGQVLETKNCQISEVTAADDTITFTRLDQGLPYNNGAFATLMYRFVPMNQINQYRLTVRNLNPGKYKLTVSGREIGIWRASEFAKGLDIASTTPDAWQPGGPWDAQATVLKSLTEARYEVDLANLHAKRSLPETPLLDSLTNQAEHANQEIEEMQRFVAKPRPYQFVLTREADETTIASPLENQVFQRHARNAGRILIRGRTTRDVDQVQVRFRGQPLQGEVPSEWQSIEFNREDGVFQKSLEFPAGGWFSMDLKLTKEGQNVAQQTVDKFGVGEVFVGAGQSNSTNSGQFKTKQTTGMVSSFSGEHWQIADDPQPGVADRSQGGSYYPAFGDALYEAYQVPIGIAATGYGGTSVNAWQPKDEGLFRWMMTRLDQLGPHGFRAILWHQGESDVEMPSDEYYDKLKRVIDTSRDEAGWNIPWLVAQVSYHNPDAPSFATTRTAQAKLWAEGVALEGPDTDTLTGDHRDFDGKGIHFSPKGLKAHGLLWCEQVKPLIDKAIQ
ncbi:GDSL-like Lipase/Acylhydrolase [Symmachiella dynata]|uniref:sialate O-acetylesterase n=1 Tax=Symmachiella dynata TaxID=2527995 RepID=UPI00118BA646|nr:sialate O-acetylesterase [Symmachiella dynata]QDT46968.1 GDSL-like Lipase/Acylhydrolase [Symmachiella dynata]